MVKLSGDPTDGVSFILGSELGRQIILFVFTKFATYFYIYCD